METFAKQGYVFEIQRAEILQDKGKVTHEIAKAFAESEFEKYRVIQDASYKSDFDRFLENINNIGKKKSYNTKQNLFPNLRAGNKNTPFLEY
ncbi:hypothetical protein [Treponema sp.]|uniref:hypothetical protein n=1 Tax=Treponema sp. TaxID=166 RepID=UPI0025E34FE9|nr:hypothetical protein [Treponema sp.]MBR4321410.1 hypothetical protein [Treponema sp.]